MTNQRLSLRRFPHDQNPTISVMVLSLVAAAAVLRLAGVPRLDTHGPLHYFGIMDPLCGGTRATFLLLTGNWSEAAEFNPVVFPLAAVVLALVARIVWGMATGSWIHVHASRAVRWSGVGALMLGLLILGVRQQLHADLLMQAWTSP